jgi:dienelactone hydrolase
MKKAFIVLAIIVLLGAVALFMMNRADHVQIDSDISVGEDIVLASQGTALSTTLLTPAAGQGPTPAVVMVVGSGAYSFRSSWKTGAFPLWKGIAEAFLGKGYAVLFLEKKGVNKSGGNWQKQTFYDRAADVLAGIRYLRTRPDIEPSRIGVCGHSQGGWIAQLAAAEYPSDIAFVVNLCGPNISIKQQIIDDQESEWRCQGVSPAKAGKKSRWLRTRLGLLGTLSRVFSLGYLSRIINYDPTRDRVADRIKCPVLAIYGEYDRLVIPATNIPLFEKGLKAGGNRNYRIVVLPGGSHGFVRIPGKCPDWNKVEEVMSPEFFEAIAAWDPFQQTGS